MITIGIDIGVCGAIAAVDALGTHSVEDLPTVPDGKVRRIDGRGLILLIRGMVPVGQPALIVFEDVRARPLGNAGAHGNTMHSQGSMMRSRGIVEAVVDITRIESSVVQPQTWKRFFGLLKSEKGASLDKARALYPAALPQLARAKDHNRAEALLIAHWARGMLA